MNLTPYPVSGIARVDAYLENSFAGVIGMSSRIAAAITCGLLRFQSEQGLRGPIGEVGAFEGRYFIALAHALQAGELALGIDVFTWPDADLIHRFEANCAKHGVPAAARVTWKADTKDMTPETLLAKLGGNKARLFHIDGDHHRASLAHDLELVTPVMAPGGLIVLDDILHPGYPTLMVTVQEYLDRHPDMRVLCIIDRESIVSATKFVLCERSWFQRYEAFLLEAYKANIWPMGADFEPDWCLVLSRDTHLAAVR